jgi:hypothetical protein
VQRRRWPDVHHPVADAERAIAKLPKRQPEADALGVFILAA